MLNMGGLNSIGAVSIAPGAVAGSPLYVNSGGTGQIFLGTPANQTIISNTGSSMLLNAGPSFQIVFNGGTGALTIPGSLTIGGARTDHRSASFTNFSFGTAGNEYFGAVLGGSGFTLSMVCGGATTGIAVPEGTLSANTTGVGNVGVSGPDDLQVYSMPGSVVIQNGRGVRIKAWGTTANNANAKTVRLTIGSGPTALITKQLAASVAGFWEINCIILRTGSSTQDYWATATNYGGTTVSATDGATVQDLATFGTLTFTETAAQDIKTQSTVSTSDNDIVSQGLTVEYI